MRYDSDMGRRKFKDCEKMQIRASIIDAALNVVKRSGLSGLTLRIVANEAGYCPANIYEYFSDKEALLVAMTCHSCNQLYERLKSLKQTDNPGADLIAMMQATIDFHLEHPESVDLFTDICFAPGKALNEFEQSVCLFAMLLKRLGSVKLKTKQQIDNALDILRVILAGSTRLISQQDTPKGLRRTRAIATKTMQVLLAGWQV